MINVSKYVIEVLIFELSNDTKQILMYWKFTKIVVGKNEKVSPTFFECVYFITIVPIVFKIQIFIQEF